MNAGRRPTDTAALAKLHDEGNDLLHDFRTVEAALHANDPGDRDYCTSAASTMRRLNARLYDLLDRLEDARGGQVVRDGDAGQVQS